MIYEAKKNNYRYFYEVSYKADELREIIEELKKYHYVKRTYGAIGVYETKIIPKADNAMKKRVIAYFNAHNTDNNSSILPETITRNTDTGDDYITYDYVYDKLPDLYYYLDILVNGKSIMDHMDLFKYVNDQLNTYDVANNSDQLIIEGILDYVNSMELFNNQASMDEEPVKKDNYDYEGLRELYRRALKCIKFNLFAIKKYVETEERLDGMSFQRKF